MNQSRKLLLVSLFSALIIVGAFIRFPLPPVPITLQTFFVLLAGLLLGGSLATASVTTYLFLGLVGLPVFTSGGGFAALLGPTGGFLIGLLPAAFVTGFIAKQGWKPGHGTHSYLVSCSIAVVVGTLIIYAAGVPWLKYSLDISWQKALMAGMIPFLPGDVIKAITAVLVSRAIKERIENFLSPEAR